MLPHALVDKRFELRGKECDFGGREALFVESSCFILNYWVLRQKKNL